MEGSLNRQCDRLPNPSTIPNRAQGSGRVGLVVAAAGSGSRVGGPVPKQFLEFRGRPLYQASLLTLLPLVDHAVVVVPAAEVERVSRELREFELPSGVMVIAGGQTRQDSVRRGLSHLGAGLDWILVHDAARPLVTRELAERVLEGARRWGACLPVLPVSDTVKEVAEGKVVRTIPRETLALAQTPQGFAAGLLRRALAEAERRGAAVTDESMLAEMVGEVAVVDGEVSNVKVTRPADMACVERLEAADPAAFRVGLGFDFHPFAPGRPLWIGGVEIPHPLGLEGHSDADVLLHALMDALLGAAGLGDIGTHFPDTDPRYRGISSLLLLEEVFRFVRSEGFRVGNVDMTVLAESPRIMPFAERIKAAIAAVLLVRPREVGVKATTLEGKGAIGRGEGIAAQAVALLYREGC